MLYNPKRRKGLPDNPNVDRVVPNELKQIYLAGGCFWGLEAYMARVYGVYNTVSGYANGHTENPSYEDLIYRGSGHAETVEVTYAPKEVSLTTLLKYYFRVIDPISVNRQGNDHGVQYRTGIYFKEETDLNEIEPVMATVQQDYQIPLAVEVMPLKHFYKAEEYHQKYLEKNQGGYCHIDLFEVETPIIEAHWYPKKNDIDLLQILSPESYAVTQQAATERPFANAYWDQKQVGLYVDITTGEPLFLTKDQFDSHCGWPSFTKPIIPEVVTFLDDFTHNMQRIEVRSRSGNAHLGHVFNDGPRETGGLRFCINSASLRFIPVEKMSEEGYGYLKHLCKP